MESRSFNEEFPQVYYFHLLDYSSKFPPHLHKGNESSSFVFNRQETFWVSGALGSQLFIGFVASRHVVVVVGSGS